MTPAERAIVAELARLSPRAAARRINELAEMVTLARDAGLEIIDECTEVLRETNVQAHGRGILAKALRPSD
jgi:hypothetical protein